MPAFLAPLDRKLLRDLWSMKGQAAAIAFVIAGGVSVYLVMAGLLSSLEETRRLYYERYRFADVWAPVVRAPNTLLEDIRRIEGVQAAETRVRVPALFDMPGMAEPATGEVFSLPDHGLPSVNQVYLMRGRLPRPGARDEAVVLQGFAEAHRLEPGRKCSGIAPDRDVPSNLLGRQRTRRDRGRGGQGRQPRYQHKSVSASHLGISSR